MNSKARNRPATSDDGGAQQFDPPEVAGESRRRTPALPRRRLEPSAMQLEVASYIEALSAELRALAKTAGLGSLAYFLEMARLEASIQVERHASTAEERSANRDGCCINY